MRLVYQLRWPETASGQLEHRQLCRNICRVDAEDWEDLGQVGRVLTTGLSPSLRTLLRLYS